MDWSPLDILWRNVVASILLWLKEEPNKEKKSWMQAKIMIVILSIFLMWVMIYLNKIKMKKPMRKTVTKLILIE